MNCTPINVTRLRVGVSIYVRKGEQSLWENGIFQNCLFLAQLLLHSPIVRSAYLVAGGGGQAADAKDFLAESPVPVIDLLEAAQMLDLMIEMSAQLDREWIVAFRARGGKIVSMRVGNDYVIDQERMLFDRAPGLLISGAPYHEVWTLTQYKRTCVSYFRNAMRAPVRVMPHLWSPMVLERAAKALPDRQRFGYRPGRKRWRIAVFEPNICMVKTSYIPMLIIDAAHRENPQMLDHVWVYNSYHMREHNGFVGFACALDIVRHGLASFEGRFPFYRVVATDVDAVVCHHWENAQNYVYYEALYGNYPLIHNSHLIGACGYRYHEFDCKEGGQALRRAFSDHDSNLDAYHRTARAFLATLDPQSQANVQAYSEAIIRLFAAQ